ncbi:MAG: hypothetical protein EAZ36_04485 [Verrucomicrobia bacterium]|nr:MAG: hypothetical protein EAZ36_04485 [Verrucomicrobiota bacterium]
MRARVAREQCQHSRQKVHLPLGKQPVGLLAGQRRQLDREWERRGLERIDLVHAGEVQGIKVKWREVGWNALIKEFAPDSIGAELLEVEA